VYICVYASLSTSRNTTYETAAYSKKHLPVLPFWAECFCILRSLSDLLFVNFVSIILWWFLLDSERHVRSYRHDTASSMDAVDTHTHTSLPTSVLLAGQHCRPRIKLCHAGPAIVVEPAAVAVAAISSVDWSVICLSGLYAAHSSSFLDSSSYT